MFSELIKIRILISNILFIILLISINCNAQDVVDVPNRIQLLITNDNIDVQYEYYKNDTTPKVLYIAGDSIPDKIMEIPNIIGIASRDTLMYISSKVYESNTIDELFILPMYFPKRDEFVQKIKNIKSLRSLTMRYLQDSDSCIFDISNLTSLWIVGDSAMNLNIPTSFTKLKNLKSLSVSKYNSITLPPDISEITTLSKVIIALYKDIMPALHSLRNNDLRELYIYSESDNYETIEIPDSTWFPNLEVLNFEKVKIASHAYFKWFRYLQKLKKLKFNACDFLDVILFKLAEEATDRDLEIEINIECPYINMARSFKYLSKSTKPKFIYQIHGYPLD